MSTRVLLKQFQSPGDILMLTAAVRDLKTHKPEWKINVETSCPEIWLNNINLSPSVTESNADFVINSDYKHEVNKSNQRGYHFSRAFTDNLSEVLKINIPISGHGPDIYFSQDEINHDLGLGEYWIINAGGKYDFTAKWWNPDHYQEVVNHFKGKIKFIQVGAREHHHPQLNNVQNLIGKTSIRTLMLMAKKSQGAITPVSFLMHVTGNMDSIYGGKVPAIVLAGGREQTSWESYDNHNYISRVGMYKCCDMGACWKTKATETFCEQEIQEKKTLDDTSICEDRVDLGGKISSPSGEAKFYIARCMHEITPKEIIEKIELIQNNRYERQYK
jgi:ADP-heptose:LPS heptosyltransferase